MASRPRRVHGRVVQLAGRAAESTDRAREHVLQRGSRIAGRAPAPVRSGLELVVATGKDASRDRVPGLAAEVALFTLISLPALLLVMVGSLGFVADALGEDGRQELDRLVFAIPRAALSDSTFTAYEQLVRPVTNEGRVDVIGFGLLLGIWTGSRATNRVLETITIAYDVEHGRERWRQRLLALGLTVGGIVAAVALLPLLVLGPRLLSLLVPGPVGEATAGAVDWAYWPITAAAVVVALSTLFHVGVPWHTPWRRDLPGAVLAMALWLVAAAALRGYLAVSGASLGGGEDLYRQLSTPIAVALWLWVSAIAVLLGAELNAEIEKRWPTGAYERVLVTSRQRGRRRDVPSADPSTQTSSPDPAP